MKNVVTDSGTCVVGFMRDRVLGRLGKIVTAVNYDLLGLAVVAMALTGLSASQAMGQSMVLGENGWEANEILTVGESINGYTPVGILDGIGAYELDDETVRVLVNHELPQNRGYSYEVSDGDGGTFELKGARVSFFDIDKDSREIVDAGLAYNTIRDANGDIAADNSFLANSFVGFSRFCSSGLAEAEQFGDEEGLENRIYFTGEEDGGTFNPVGGAQWALDPETGDLWHVPSMGRGAWENIAEICTGSEDTVAFILADDTSPFNLDGDAKDEAAPLYLYIGEKDPDGDFLARNGLRGGKLYVWVAANPNVKDPSDFNTSGTRQGRWVEIDNRPTGAPSENGATGFDEYGYPTQRTLWKRAEAAGAFQFSRPEDVSTNPERCNEIVLASTGVDTFAVDPATGNGVDTFGIVYTINTNFRNLKARVKIIYDGDADPTRALRSPDNLDWADDGFVYIQEDKAEEDTLICSADPSSPFCEVLFGPEAVNPNEAGIVKLNPKNGKIERIANIDRTVVLDGSIDPASGAIDLDSAEAGEWETSGILDVSELFGLDDDDSRLFIFDVQAHGIEDQTAPSRINDDDLVEGGQLLFLELTEEEEDDDDEEDD